MARHEFLYFILSYIKGCPDRRSFGGGHDYFIIDIIIRRTDAMCIPENKPYSITRYTANMKAAIQPRQCFLQYFLYIRLAGRSLVLFAKKSMHQFDHSSQVTEAYIVIRFFSYQRI